MSVAINQAIFKAIDDKNLDTLKFLLKNVTDIEFKDSTGQTPLISASKGRLDAMKLLLEHGANIEAKVDIHGFTPLHVTSVRGDLVAIKLLLEKGANIESKDKDGSTPLVLASKHGKLDSMNLLLEHGANIEQEDGITPLLISASENGNLDEVKLLIKHGADVNIETLSVRIKIGTYAVRATALMETTDFDVAQFLLENGADVNFVDQKDGISVLHYMYTDRSVIRDGGVDIFGGDIDMIELLLLHGAFVDTEDRNGKTVLQKAIEKGDTETVKLLIEYGSSVDSFYDDDNNLIKMDDFELMKLIERRRNPNLASKKIIENFQKEIDVLRNSLYDIKSKFSSLNEKL